MAFFFKHTNDYFNTGCFQLFNTFTIHLFKGIAAAHHHCWDFMFNDQVDAGRSFTVVSTRLKRNVNSSVGKKFGSILKPLQYLVYGIHLSMSFAVLLMVPLTYDQTVMHDNSPHHRVWADTAYTQIGKFKATAHVGFVMGHGAKIGLSELEFIEFKNLLNSNSANSLIQRILVQTFSFLCRMKTVKDVFAEFRQELSSLYDASEIESLTLLILSEILETNKAKLKAFPEQELTPEQTDRTTKVLSRLKTGEPVQYILGYTEFYGLPLKVNPSVLIPRPETEELVEWVLNSGQLTVGSILDIGTGSGCIAISLKKNLTDAQVSAIDISTGALETARENAKVNEVKVDFINADILNLKSEIVHPKFEIIISNPPYVTLEDKKQMHTNVTDFEPHTALFVPENDPLIFYKAIVDFASGHLEKGGLLFFEINENHGEQLVELLSHKSFINIELRKDMSGRDRMIKAQIGS